MMAWLGFRLERGHQLPHNVLSISGPCQQVTPGLFDIAILIWPVMSSTLMRVSKVHWIVVLLILHICLIWPLIEWRPIGLAKWKHHKSSGGPKRGRSAAASCQTAPSASIRSPVALSDGLRITPKRRLAIPIASRTGVFSCSLTRC